MLLKCFLTTQASADPSRPGLLALVLHLIHKWAHLGDTRDLCTTVQATPQALTGISPGGWDGRNGGLLLSALGQHSVEVLCQLVKLSQSCIFKSKRDLQKCGATQTCSTSITWELLRNASSQAQTHRNSGGGAQRLF